MDLADYYHTSEDEAALILQDTISETKGKMVDGEAYLPYSIITKELGGRFYWDKESEKMLYTTATGTLEIKPEDTTYTIAEQVKQQDYVIVKEIGEEFYIALDFAEQYKMCIRDRMRIRRCSSGSFRQASMALSKRFPMIQHKSISEDVNFTEI